MRNILLGLTLLTFATAASAQGGKRLIFWSGDANCGVKSRAIVLPETVKCEQVMTERGPVSKITYDGIALAVAFLEDDDRLIVGAHITNTTDEFIGFDTDIWGAAHFKTKSGFYAGDKPIAAETSLPTREMIREMARGSKLENAAGDVVADNQMTTETRKIRRPDGTEYTRTTIVKDKEAKEAETRQQFNRAENLTSEQRRIRSTALTTKSVPPGGSVKGLVYFNAYKKAEFVIYSLRVADTTFVFQLPRVKK
jgi:hypothetical protein